MLGGSERIRRRLDVVAVIGLIGWLAFDLTARTVFGAAPWPQSVVDYHILYECSRHVVANHEYPPHFPYPYPPPAVAVHAATATTLPFALAAPLWLALTGLAAGGCYLTLARVLELHRRPGMLLVLPLAHVVVAYYFQWDMRSINCNLLMLAAVLFGCACTRVGAEDLAAGFWFAFRDSPQTATFPHPAVPGVDPTLGGHSRSPRGSRSRVLGVPIPQLVAFGTSGTRAVYTGWAGELTRAHRTPTLNRIHPVLISPRQGRHSPGPPETQNSEGMRLSVGVRPGCGSPWAWPVPCGVLG